MKLILNFNERYYLQPDWSSYDIISKDIVAREIFLQFFIENPEYKRVFEEQLNYSEDLDEKDLEDEDFYFGTISKECYELHDDLDNTVIIFDFERKKVILSSVNRDTEWY